MPRLTQAQRIRILGALAAVILAIFGFIFVSNSSADTGRHVTVNIHDHGQSGHPVVATIDLREGETVTSDTFGGAYLNNGRYSMTFQNPSGADFTSEFVSWKFETDEQTLPAPHWSRSHDEVDMSQVASFTLMNGTTTPSVEANHEHGPSATQAHRFRYYVGHPADAGTR